MRVRKRDELGDRVGLGNRVRIRDDDVFAGGGRDSRVDVGREPAQIVAPDDPCSDGEVAVDAVRAIRHDHELVDLRLQRRGRPPHELGLLGTRDDHDPGDLHAPIASR